MNAIMTGRRPPSASVVARRALDLARDGRLSLDDGAHHLCHLTNGERGPLDEALQRLRVTPEAEPEEQCARMLLCRALTMLDSSSRMDRRSD